MLKVNKPVYNFYFGASMDIIAKARVLRKNMTTAESVLWEHLRRKRWKGIAFADNIRQAGLSLISIAIHSDWPLNLTDQYTTFLNRPNTMPAEPLNLNDSAIQFSASEMKKFCEISTS